MENFQLKTMNSGSNLVNQENLQIFQKKWSGTWIEVKIPQIKTNLNLNGNHFVLLGNIVIITLMCISVFFPDLSRLSFQKKSMNEKQN